MLVVDASKLLPATLLPHALELKLILSHSLMLHAHACTALSKTLPSQSCCLQDPSYPVYVDSSVIMGMTGEYDEGSKGFGKLQYMVCRPENDFFPDLSKVANCCQCTSKGRINCRKSPAGLCCPACTALAHSGRRGADAYYQLAVPWAFTLRAGLPGGE